MPSIIRWRRVDNFHNQLSTGANRKVEPHCMMSSKALVPQLIIVTFLTSCSSELTWEESFQRLQLYRDAGEEIGKRRCEKPSKVEARKQANVHYPEVTDTFRTYYCPNATIEIYESRLASNPEIVQQVTSHKPVSLPFGIGVGSTRAQVKSALGKATMANERGLQYSIETDSISFFIEKELVTKVIWSSNLL